MLLTLSILTKAIITLLQEKQMELMRHLLISYKLVLNEKGSKKRAYPSLILSPSTFI